MPVSFKAVRDTGKAVDATATTASLRKNMDAYCKFLIESLRRDYVVIPEGPNYKRKFKPPSGAEGLGGHWRSSVSGDGQTGDVYNDAPYAKFVQGHIGQQSDFNRQLGWRSIDEVVISTIPFFNKQIGDAIQVGLAKARQNRTRTGQFTFGFGD